LSAILLQPALDHGDVRRLILAGLMFVPVILSTVRFINSYPETPSSLTDKIEA
jgi:hypothetical protein